MKPIEEGCLAVVIGLPLSGGKTVTVGKYLGKVKGWGGNDRWETDFYFPNALNTTRENHCKERCLMRIDDYEEQDQVSESKKKELIK